MTQRALATASVVDYRRISAFERGLRLPNACELPAIAKALGLELGELELQLQPHRTKPRLLVAERRGLREVLRDYRPPRDRSTWVRLAAARRRYPQVGPWIEEVMARADSSLVRWFLREVPCGSSLEAVLWVQFLREGGRPVWEAPLLLGFRRYVIVDPGSRVQVGDRRVPALIAYHENCVMLVFAQVGLMTGQGLQTVDGLVRIRCGETSRWLILEADGMGHDRGADDRRAQLGLPVVRLTEAEVLGDGFLARLASKLMAAAVGPK